MVANGGTLAPGNSIGTLTVNGNVSFAERRSIYQVEANAAGQSDKHHRWRYGDDQRRQRASAGAKRHLCAADHLHDLDCQRRRQRRLLERHQQLRIPDPLAHLRRQQRVSDPVPVRFRRRRADSQPVRRRHRSRPGQCQCHRGLRNRVECAQCPQHAAGAGGAERHQRPALCRFRHDERAESACCS